jgi:drug/metabolite transporter (DMT)-like permease
MVWASFSFTVMHLFAKSLVVSIPVAEITFFRSLVTLLLVWPWMVYKKISFFGAKKGLLFIRGLFGFTSLFLGFFAISQINLSDVTVLWKTSVIFTAFFAMVFLKERVSLVLVGFIFLAMIGATLIVKPNFDVMNIGGLAAILAGVCVGVVTVSVRKLHQTESTLTIIFSFSFWSVIFALIVFGHKFIYPRGIDWLFLLLMGAAGTIGQLFFTRAFLYAPASVTQPYAFSEVIFSMLAAFFIWGELPDYLSFIGTILIILAGIGILQTANRRVESVTEES